jgi:hypothetical protein
LESDRESDDLSDEAKLALGLEYARSAFEWQMEVYRVAYTNTKNPVYVWKALRWLAPLMQRSLLAPLEVPPPGWGAPPPWCMEYLLTCADAVEDLCYGFDPRDADIELTEGQRAEVLPAVFGFTKPGWNAFAHYYSIKEMEYVEEYLQELRDAGEPYSVALAKAAERYDYQDERSLRRRLAKRRAVFRDPTDEEPEQGQT